VGPLGLGIHCAPLLVGHSPIPSLDGFDNARVFYFWSILYYYYSVYNLIPNLIERLGWTWHSVFSVGGHIRVWSIFWFIILFYLAGLFEISVCPKSFLLWPLIGTEKVGMRSSGPQWYSVASHLLLYSVLCFTGSQLLLAIWQLKSYSISVWFILWGRLPDSANQSMCFIAIHSPNCPNCRSCSVIAVQI
jgi:hypothetical protein